MKISLEGSTDQQATLALPPVPGVVNLLDDAAVGCCGNGVCQLPAPKAE